VLEAGLLMSSMEQQTKLVGRVKNTFLDFEEEDSDDAVIGYSFISARPSSDPTSSRSSSYESLSGSEMLRAPCKFRNVSKPGEDCEKYEAHKEQKKRHRPNNSKSHAFLKYVNI